MNGNALMESPRLNSKPKKTKKKIIISLIILAIIDILLFIAVGIYRNVEPSTTYTPISQMRISGGQLSEGYVTDGEIHSSGETSGYVQFTGIGQTITTPSLSSHAEYRVGIAITALIFYASELYDVSIATFEVRAYNISNLIIAQQSIMDPLAGTIKYAIFRQSGIDHFAVFHSGPARFAPGGHQALAGLGTLIIEIPKEAI